MQLIYLALTAIPALGILDFIWIGWLGKGFYQSQLGALLTSNPVWSAAAVFYLLYALALAFFVINPAIEAHSLTRAILTGAFLGLTAYGTYDLVNLIGTTGWPALVTVVDMAYGVIASAIVSGVVYWIATALYGF